MSAIDPTRNSDPIFESFLARQFDEGRSLAASSDLLELHFPPIEPPHVVAEFRCKGLIRSASGEIQESSQFHVGIWFPPDYLRRSDPFQMLRLFTENCWHPNIRLDAPFICVGRLTPGTSLVDILYQVFDILTWQKYNPRENDSLNRAACAWARSNQSRFPIDRRPLKRKPLNLEVYPHVLGES